MSGVLTYGVQYLQGMGIIMRDSHAPSNSGTFAKKGVFIAFVALFHFSLQYNRAIYTIYRLYTPEI